jgi:hypothetical protein
MFKVNYIVRDKIEKIFIFFGSHKLDDGINKVEPNQLYKIEPTNPLFENIFSKEELENIEREKIEVELIEQYIHLDDSIETIKQKIKHVFSNTILFEEIYMFYAQETMLDTNKIYKQLTQNKKKKITVDSMLGFLLNFNDLENKSPEPKNNYEIDDLLQLDIFGNKLIKKPLGHKLTSSMFKYYFTTNPYESIKEDPYIQENVSQMISTNNSNLLMDYGKIDNNNIYVVLGKDIIDETTTTTFINTYFPFLINVGIKNRDDYDKIKPEIIENQTVDLLSFKTNDLFYNIYKDERSEKNIYNDQGIYSIQFIKFQSDSVRLPLETIFKLIHSTQDVPLIQYVAGQKKEPIYKLFVDKYSKDGKKIPFLSKKKIIQIINSMSSAKAISYYIYTADNINLRCEINMKGEISVALQLRELFTVDKVNSLIKKYINPILIQIQTYMKQSGYDMSLFTSLNDTDIEISNINYKFNVKMKKKINFTSYMGCLSSAFNIISSKLKNDIIMKFKKVSNFSKMSSYEELITKLINQASTNNEIINSLKSNFNYNDDKALDIFNKFIEEKAVERDFHENRKIKVKEQPGFEIIIRHDQYTSNIVIDVTGINNILYLDTVPIYIDSLLKINDETVSSDYKDDVNGLCKRSVSKVKESVTEDIVAEVEKPKQGIIIESSKLMGSTADHDDIFDAFYEDSEDEDEEIKVDDKKNKEDDDDEDEDEDDDEDEDEDDDEDEDEFEDDGLIVFNGGTKQTERVGIMDQTISRHDDSDNDDDKNIEGLPLKSPSIFQERMNNKDPVLFLKKPTGKFKAYATACGYNVKRQPIILTDSEKERIDSKHPGSYSDALKYGSTPDKQYWYICPRYWCLKTETSLTEKEVEDGVCGGRDAIIPPKASKVPKGKSIFEFNYAQEHIDSDGKYKTHYPGFLTGKSHPDNYLVPCCFGKPQKEKNEKRIKGDIVKGSEREMYIMAPETRPTEIDVGRYAYLPFSIQLFLNSDNTKCYSSINQNLLKKDTPCLLRHGIEYSENQSFLYCIADFLSTEVLESDKTGKKVMKQIKRTISQVKTMIIDVVTVDKFIMYHNGNLIELFKPPTIDYTKPINSFYTTGKTKSKYYDKLNKSSKKQMNLFIQIIASYENFRNYISDDNSFIDHSYMWDIICSSNGFFTDGLNLVIMEVSDDDVRSNVNIYCPTNHYSTNFFDIEKNTLLLIKTNNIYEPIYQYTDIENGRPRVLKYFNFTKPDILPNLKSFLLEIQKYFTNCKPLRSSPRIYNFVNNIILTELEDELKKINGVVTSYIINYNNKVIAVKATLVDRNITGILPCYPSSLNDNSKDIVFIDDISIWLPYNETLLFLNEVKRLNSNILCNPHSKVLEDGLIVGILTETNQFIMISQPTENIDDDLPVSENKNFTEVDNATLTSTEPTPRDEFIRNIKLETNFYNSFKNLTRTILNKIENRKIKNELRDYINNNTDPYHLKLEKVIEEIRKLLAPYISFSHYSHDIIDKLSKITTCYNNSTCDEHFCLKSGTGECKINIPQVNLINNLNNETVYFARISDEMIRFNRVKSFIFDPDIYLSFLKINYDLYDNEIILMQSSIFGKGYLDYLEYEPSNKYVTNNVFDVMLPDPLTSQKYSNVMENKKIKASDIMQVNTLLDSSTQSTAIINTTQETQKNSVQMDVCSTKISPLDIKLAKFFPESYKSKEYERNNNCGIQLLYDLLRENEINLTKSKIMIEIFNMYQHFMENHKDRLFDILKSQEKETQIEKIEKNIITFEDYIMSEEYFITELDILLFCIHFDISVILIPNKDNVKRRGKMTSINLFPSKYNDKGKYYIITNYLYKLKDQSTSTTKYKIISDSSDFKSDFDSLQLHFNSNPDLKISISNHDDLKIEDFRFETHYLELSPKKNLKKKSKILLKYIDSTE